MIPKIDLKAMNRGDRASLDLLKTAIETHGVLIIHNTPITSEVVKNVIEAYRAFFHLQEAEKSKVSMTKTGANRGWGASMSEQVDPSANPDYKEVFDSGLIINPNHPDAQLSVYAPNQWPDHPANFVDFVTEYYGNAMSVAMDVLRAIAGVMNLDRAYFDDKFDTPMALLRGNYYPQRPVWAGRKDFGIASHTDYGCVTLLGTDGVSGLEAQTRAGDWVAINPGPGEFVINFGEMLQSWTAGQVRATPHRVRGSDQERVSVPLFFNPNYHTNVAPMGSGQTLLAGHHLTKRFAETYLHLKR